MATPLDDRAMLARLLQRTGFGVSPQDLERSADAGFEAALDRVLAAGDDPGEAATPAPELGPLPKRGTATGKENSAARDAYRAAVKEQREELILWWLDRMTAVERPWREKRTLLWHDHWATSIQKVKSGAAMLAQNETLRSLGGGDFRTLAREMVRDPALMLWLDAAGNTAKAPNENLARELMELFVLGVGNYSEDDVRQAAAALTGWSVDRRDDDGWSARFRPKQHAQSAQRVLGRTTDFTAKALVDHLVDQPESAHHVAERLWGRLVSFEKPPSDQSLARIAEAYGEGRDTTAMVRAILTDPAFTAPENVLVKQPVEYVVGTLRAFGLRPARLEKPARRTLLKTLGGLGQTPFAPPSVGGWPGGAAWLTTSAALQRIGFARLTARVADLSAVERESAGDRPEALARLLGVGSWSAATSDALTTAARDPKRVTEIALAAPEYLILP